MKQLFIILTAVISLAAYSCGNQTASSTAAQAEINSTANKNEKTSANKDEQTSASQLLDTGKLQSDLNDMMSAVTSGNPDTTKLKKAAGDFMQTDAAMLSDSGIDKMYGNSNDPSVVAAKNALKKMRDEMGITPDKFDSIKKAAATIKQNTSH